MQEKIYPAHIYDRVRRELAAQLVHKELIKLFPSLDRAHWANLLPDINDWFSGEKSQLASVHDFWNGSDGILAGFKLKSVVTYITAENIQWQKIEIPVEQLSIHWGLPSLKALGKPPYTYGAVREYLTDPAVHAEQVRVAKLVASSAIDRDGFPVVVLKGSQKMTLLDGNRRVMQAFLDDAPTILAWVGTLQGEGPQNYWVSTAYLRSILRTAEAADLSQDQVAVDACRQILQLLFRESDIARINWHLRCRPHSDMAASLTAE